MQYREYNYDLLLEYLSRKEADSYFNFKKYVLNLNYELTRDAVSQELALKGKSNFDIDTEFRAEQSYFISKSRQMLSRLAHCEFFFQNNKSKFVITPPVICMFNGTHKGVLCGKRTSDMTLELEKICAKSGCEYIENENINAPKAIFVDFHNQNNQTKFQKLLNNAQYISDLKIQENFSEIILTNIPKVSDLAEEVTQGNLDEYKDFDEQLTEGQQIFDCNISDCIKFGFIQRQKKHVVSDWGVIKDNQNRYSPSYYIKYDKKYYAIDKYYGMLLNLYNSNHIPLLTWQDDKLVKKKSWLKFPELIERVLTLQSGYNVETTKTEIIYSNIDTKTADLISKVTALEVEYE